MTLVVSSKTGERFRVVTLRISEYAWYASNDGKMNRSKLLEDAIMNQMGKND